MNIPSSADATESDLQPFEDLELLHLIFDALECFDDLRKRGQEMKIRFCKLEQKTPPRWALWRFVRFYRPIRQSITDWRMTIARLLNLWRRYNKTRTPPEEFEKLHRMLGHTLRKMEIEIVHLYAYSWGVSFYLKSHGVRLELSPTMSKIDRWIDHGMLIIFILCCLAVPVGTWFIVTRY